MSSDADKAKAQEFKTKGNAFFTSKNYTAAIDEYNKAIELDRNAILFANRAACSLATGRYLDAATDCQTAVDLDPTYSKAWARLALSREKLSSPSRAIEAWQKAYDTMPTANLTPAQTTQKKQYKMSLDAMKAYVINAQNNPVQPHVIHMQANSAFPWVLAKALIPGYLAQGRLNSSAYVISEAYDDFKKGVEIMEKRRETTIMGKPAQVGFTGSIECFSNGIMRDTRVFHITRNDFVSVYNEQVKLEAQQTNAWVDAGPQEIIKQLPLRQQTEGWDSARRSVTTTVRSWIMRGVLETTLREAHETGLGFFANAIEVLEWGSKTWKNIPKEQKGTIFSTTFVRQVHCMHLEAFMQAHSKNGPGKFPLESVNKLADDILAEIESNPISGGDLPPGFYLSFVVYPSGQAYAMKGYYHSRTASILNKDKGPTNKVAYHLEQSITYYLKAARVYPLDDELHLWYLKIAADYTRSTDIPFRVTHEIVQEMRTSLPQVLQIWKNSTFMTGPGLAEVRQLLVFDTETMKKVQAGEMTMDDPNP